MKNHLFGEFTLHEWHVHFIHWNCTHLYSLLDFFHWMFILPWECKNKYICAYTCTCDHAICIKFQFDVFFQIWIFVSPFVHSFEDRAFRLCRIKAVRVGIFALPQLWEEEKKKVSFPSLNIVNCWWTSHSWLLWFLVMLLFDMILSMFL